MKHIIVIIAIAVAVLGCDISRFASNSGGNNASSPTASPTAPSPVTSPSAEASPAAPSFISILAKSAGKYPADIKLLKIPELRDRLKKLVGRDFADLESHWNVESPIKITDGIFKASACEAHNCGPNTYFIFVDLKKNNINVYHIEDDVTKDYFESGKIELPAGSLEF
ncbi:MAG: hypothetical protein KBD94_09805 [Pyrinomonadaceae bacterium]|nr:hypothetical protein [Pyrinomonadaceae bacterium]